MESWEVDQKINSHPVIQQLLPHVNELLCSVSGLMSDRAMIHQMRGEVDYDIYPHPNGHIYQRLTIMEQRVNNHYPKGIVACR